MQSWPPVDPYDNVSTKAHRFLVAQTEIIFIFEIGTCSHLNGLAVCLCSLSVLLLSPVHRWNKLMKGSQRCTVMFLRILRMVLSIWCMKWGGRWVSFPQRHNLQQALFSSFSAFFFWISPLLGSTHTHTLAAVPSASAYFMCLFSWLRWERARPTRSIRSVSFGCQHLSPQWDTDRKTDSVQGV